MFTTNTVQTGAVPTLQYQDHPTQKSQGKNIENVQQKNTQQTQQTQEFPTFCYTTNVNMIGKIGTSAASGTGGVNITQLTTSDDKTCYIAQPFSYANYALVNQMQIAPNGIQNTISNISFKCDVCGLMFGHLTLLNAHKRIHAQDTDNNITVVATGVSNGNDVSMPPHIQILSSDSTEQPQHHVQLQESKPVIIEKIQKCITCGGSITNNPKRKGPKLIRCENCIAQDSVDQQRNNQLNATHVFVSSEENLKFEVSEVRSGQPTTDPLAAAPTNQQNQQQQKPLPGHHPVKRRNLASVTKCQNCNGSGIIFVGGNKNKLNQSSLDKPFHCNICGGSFARYSSLWSHKKLHSGEKNFKCGICGIAFAKAVYLKNHSRIHTGEKPYRCNTCGMQFSQSPHLKNHERTHSGEKPYVCEVCDKGFARHATLWNHRRIHTGEKPYKCETCGSAFSQAAHLKNHAKVHSGEKPFKCDICTAAFADRFALKRHRGIHDKYGQTAPLPSRIHQNQQEQQQTQQNTEQQSTQPAVEVEHHTEQTL